MNETNLLYILSIKDGSEKELKIGITNNIKKRLRNLQTGNSEIIKVEHIEEIDQNINIRELEGWLHSTFYEKKKKGEWFIGIEVRQVRRMILKYFIK